MNMQEQVAKLYTSVSEIQHLSNLYHIAYGVMLIVLVIVICLAFLRPNNKKIQYFPAVTVLLMAIGFIISLTFHKGIGNIPALTSIMLYFPHATIHFAMGFVNIAGSIIEIARLKGKVSHPLALWALPLTFILIAILFVVHPHNGQHIHQEMEAHAKLGLLLSLAGSFYLLSRLSASLRWLAMCAFAGFTLTASILLLQYREQPHAYAYAFPPAVSTNEASRLDSQGLAYFYIYKNFVVPQHVKIATGGTVKFIVMDESMHDMASGPHPTHTNFPPLNMGIATTKEIKTVSFPKSGLYGFHDHINETNEKLQGTILVED